MAPRTRKRTLGLAVLLLLTLPLRVAIVGHASPPPEDGPVGAWAFDDGEGTTTEDWSGGHHDGTLVNGVAWTPDSYFGAALGFDGVDDVVTVPNHADFNATTELTVSMWVSGTISVA